MQKPIYFDYAATTPLDPLVLEKMQQYLATKDNFGNPASISHRYGRNARTLIEHARVQVAELINADPEEIIWTSGATESINLALKGVAYFYQNKGKHIITSKTEHKAVLDTCQYLEKQGFFVTYLTPQPNGLLDLADLIAAINKETILISIMQVNNEIGVIQDIKKIAEIAKGHKILLHVDAAQSAGKIDINLSDLSVDLMSFSAHKIYGPKGVGALYIARKSKVRIEPLIHGGGHEHGLRSGTLATHQIVAMGEAFRIAKTEMFQDDQRILMLRNRLWEGIKNIEGLTLNGDWQHRIAGILNFSVAYVDGEALIMSMPDLALATASACTSSTIEPSHVLTALGLEKGLAHSSIRLSIGRFTTTDEIDFAIKYINEKIAWLRAFSPKWDQRHHV